MFDQQTSHKQRGSRDDGCPDERSEFVRQPGRERDRPVRSGCGN